MELSDSSLNPRFRAGNRFLGMPKHGPRLLKKFTAGNCQAESPGLPLKQPDRDFVFKITNLPTDSWLRNVQSQSCVANGFFMNWYGVNKGEGFEFHILAIGLALVVMIGGAGKASIDAFLSRKLKG